MDRQRFSAIAHASLQFCSPVSEATLVEFLDHARLQPGGRVLDIGAGHGGMAYFIADHWSANVDAVERSPWMVTAARTKSPARGRVCVYEREGATFVDDVSQPYDLVMAIGVDSIFGGPVVDTLRRLKRCMSPTAHLFFGHTYWLQSPSPAYLDKLGISAEAMTDHHGNIQAARSAGFNVVLERETTLSDRDTYEAAYAAGIEQHSSAGDDPDAPAFTDRIAMHRELYRKHGRDTMGFGLYLLEPA